MNYEKVYVTVYLRVDTEGITAPVCLEWVTGQKFNIDRVVSERMSPPEHVGAILTRRYEIIIEGFPRILYNETGSNKWFIERRVP